MATTTATKEQQSPAGYIAWGVLGWLGLMHLGGLLAFYPGFFSWSGVALLFILHWLTGGIGICMTYHRLLTHRSFVTRPKALEYLLTAIGCCASEGGAIGWVADHRRHHAHSDHRRRRRPQPPPELRLGPHVLVDDPRHHRPPHSRILRRSGPPTSSRTRSRSSSTRWHLVFPISASSWLLYFAGQATGKNLGMPWLVWAGFVRTVPRAPRDLAGELGHARLGLSDAIRPATIRPISGGLPIITYGEGWHNNHHAFQTSVRHGLAWWEIDTTYI